MTKIEKAIIKTLTFFDIFARPLTLEEIWHFLYKIPSSKLQVLIYLRNLQKKGKIRQLADQKNNYYVIFERSRIIDTFLAKQKLIRERLQKVDWVVKILRLAPFVKNISVINSLSFGTSRQASDIDILLIAKKGRLWTARAFVILFLEILGQNKNKWYQANKFCLGFAFDESRLDLAKIRLKKDIYLTYWLAYLVPVFDRGIYQKFLQANPWVFEELPNWQAKATNREKSSGGILEKILSGKFGQSLEKFLARIQIDRIWKDPENRRKGASVIADPSMLKLHPYDKRLEYQREWEALTKKEILR